MHGAGEWARRHTSMRRQKTRYEAIPWAIIAALAALAVWAQRSAPEKAATQERVAFEATPARVMGTSCRLLAVVGRGEGEERRARAALADAEAALRGVEARMSTRIDSSPLSRVNQAGAGERVLLPSDVLEVIAAARAAHRETMGAFDATCAPLIALWREAGELGQVPDAAAIARARAASRMDDFASQHDSVTKARASARLDLGGIAKGFGIDAATDAMQRAGVLGGFVDVGGDLRVFGTPPSSERWLVAVRDPHDLGATLVTIELDEGAVCTSGDYHRFVEIEGRKLSHIIDPRSGWPVATIHSATVRGRSAMTADAWATALSVLGEEGLALLPEGLEAMLVRGDGGALQTTMSSGFL